jgi:hypothetical protein
MDPPPIHPKAELVRQYQKNPTQSEGIPSELVSDAELVSLTVAMQDEPECLALLAEAVSEADWVELIGNGRWREMLRIHTPVFFVALMRCGAVTNTVTPIEDIYRYTQTAAAVNNYFAFMAFGSIGMCMANKWEFSLIAKTVEKAMSKQTTVILEDSRHDQLVKYTLRWAKEGAVTYEHWKMLLDLSKEKKHKEQIRQMQAWEAMSLKDWRIALQIAEVIEGSSHHELVSIALIRMGSPMSVQEIKKIPANKFGPMIVCAALCTEKGKKDNMSPGILK